MGPDDISRFHQILEVLLSPLLSILLFCFLQPLGMLILIPAILIFRNNIYYIFLLSSCSLLQARMREANKSSKVPRYVRRIELVQKKSIMYYQPESSQPFLKIVVALPTMVTSCRGKILESLHS